MPLANYEADYKDEVIYKAYYLEYLVLSNYIVEEEI